MKTLILSGIFLLSTSLGAFAQQKSIQNDAHKKQIEQIDQNLYSVTFTDEDGKTLQKGQYWKEKGHYKPHGIWTLYCTSTGELVTRSKFDKGTQQWIETRINGKMVMFTEKELEIKVLKEKIKTLESRLAKIENDGS
jgi:hypothetical protein